MNIGERIAALTESLAGLDDRWREAMHAVPRHWFVPDRAWCHPDSGSGYLIDRRTGPQRWIEAVYSDAAIVTQINDGAVDVGSGKGDYTSSSSAPGIVAAELGLLAPGDNDKILEIGTGTGWTAALLAHRLGDANVTSIEIDPALFALAAGNLRRAGHHPRLILGDGAHGRPEEAPYDGVHVTCGVSRMPYAWVRQTRPGGTIVLPWTPRWEAGHLTKLTVTADGRAVGRFHRGAVFMPMRSQRPHDVRLDGPYRDSITRLDPRQVVRSPAGADVAIAGLLPDLYDAHADEEDGGFRLWLWSDDSEAQIHQAPGYDRFSVFQRGPHDLWDELEVAYRQWLAWGSPGRDRFGMSVTPEGQYVWLDSPDRRVRLRA
ncbi:methyltransferase domain-containing protein [Nonomuraea sp. ZG12]|uniref:methyltransferase domain-containing protein n=1 Tax=Nonomuraea sp. ZG12 TaxID=3452207 RepID=UPI003F8BD5C3